MPGAGKSIRPIYLIGPTGVGKTQISLLLARKINAEIIVADSMQVYRGLDIGTAKPSFSERGSIPHHLLDVVKPDKIFNVIQFVKLAEQRVLDIQHRQKTPLVVGGTGLYIKALTDGIFEGPGADALIRRKYEAMGERDGWPAVFEILKRLDPISASRIDLRQHRRMIRALEVYELTGQSLSDLQTQWKKPQENICIMGLMRERKDLYERIHHRVEAMIEAGLVDEIKNIYKNNIASEDVLNHIIGYREILAHLQGKINLEQAIDIIKKNTRNFAKRQMTWFRKDNRIRWFVLDENQNLFSTIEDMIEYADGFLAL